MDSDEEEMAAMRSSSRFGGNRNPGASSSSSSAAKGRAGDDSDNDAPASTAASSSRGGGGARSSRADSDDEEPMVVEEEIGEMRGFLPISFGKKKEVKKIGIEVHQGTARKPRGLDAASASSDRKKGVQFGPRKTDLASVAGAKGRADKAEEAAKAKEAAKKEGAGMEVDEAEANEEPEDEAADELPLPGKEQEVVPVSHEVSIPAHEKAATAIALDPKGSRMVSGGIDGTVKYYDFNGMSEAKEPFRVLEPTDGKKIQSLAFSTFGGVVLVVCSDSHARIYDRDGSSKPVQTTVKGDMYVRDMQHTKGHTQMLTSGVWHPFANEQWLTSSLDGTLRIWDINAECVGMDQVLPSVHVLKTVDKRNVCVGGAAGRAGGLHPSCCAYSPRDGKLIVGGCSDGSVQVFFEKQRYMRPDRVLRTAHTGLVSDVAFITKGTQSNLMVTRALDDTVKIWDCRMLSDAKGPVKTFTDLASGGNEKAGLCVSPDGRYLVAGTAASKGALGSATVRVWGTEDFNQVKSLDFGNKTPIRFKWPGELNQLIVTTSTGEITMLYSPFSSKKGALHFVGKKAKTRAAHEMDSEGTGPIFNMTDKDDIKKFWSTGHGNMQSIRRAEVRASQKTLTPVRPPNPDKSSAGASDSMAFAALVIKHGAKQLHLNKANQVEADSQKALLAYADKVDKIPSLMGDAYAKTQPVNVLDWSVQESEGDQRMSSNQQGDFCRKCGQKMCRCFDYSIIGKKRQKTG